MSHTRLVKFTADARSVERVRDVVYQDAWKGACRRADRSRWIVEPGGCCIVRRVVQSFLFVPFCLFVCSASLSFSLARWHANGLTSRSLLFLPRHSLQLYSNL